MPRHLSRLVGGLTTLATAILLQGCDRSRGTLEYEIGDQPPVTVKPGDVLFVPAGAVDAAKNVGSGPGAELATSIVEKGKPLITVVK